MKKAGVFYLIVMMLLSAMPCSDGAESLRVNANLIQLFSAHEDDGDEEACSLACLCSCCGQRVVMPQANRMQTPLDASQVSFESSFNDAKPKQRQSSIWNPPKTV